MRNGRLVVGDKSDVLLVDAPLSSIITEQGERYDQGMR